VLGKITPLWQPEINLFVDVLDQGSYKMQNVIITVPLSMLGIALISIGKLCWPWEDITVKISMNGKGVLAPFTHWLSAAARIAKLTLMGFTQSPYPDLRISRTCLRDRVHSEG